MGIEYEMRQQAETEAQIQERVKQAKENGNVNLEELTSDEKKIYDRRLREAMPIEGDDPGFLSKLDQMWDEKASVRDAFFPEYWREKNQGRCESIGHETKLQCKCGSQPMGGEHMGSRLVGSHKRGLQLPKSHGVFIEGCAVAHEKDRDVGDKENIRSFGVCSSVHHPLHTKSFMFDGLANMFNGHEKIILQSQDDPSRNVKGYECIPVIVGDWLNPYEGLRIASNESYVPGTDAAHRENFPVVTYESFLVCRFGGLIEPVYEGDNEGEAQ